jgi:hypothetical protein
MATTVKTFIVDAADGKTESDAPYDALATFMGSEDDCQVSVTRLNGDRLFIIATKNS